MSGSTDGSKRERENHYRRAAMFHPLRQRIGRLLSGDTDTEIGAAELSARLERPLRETAHHLRVLLRRGVLTVVPRRRPTPPLYRWSEDAQWAREMLIGKDE